MTVNIPDQLFPVRPSFRHSHTKYLLTIARLYLLMIPPPTTPLAAHEVLFPRLDGRLVQIMQLPFRRRPSPLDLHLLATRLEPGNGFFALVEIETAPGLRRVKKVRSRVVLSVGCILLI